MSRRVRLLVACVATVDTLSITQLNVKGPGGRPIENKHIIYDSSGPSNRARERTVPTHTSTFTL